MTIPTQKYQELVDLYSSDEDEAYDINKQQKQKDYPFATKSQFMKILTDLNKQNYTSIPPSSS